MASCKVKQDELRKLMRERREKKLGTIEVESPFAKYDSSGLLTCSICNVAVKSSNLWGTHIAGKIHKENLTKHKKSSSSIDSSNTVVIGIKRNTDQPEIVKKQKSHMKPTEEPEPPKPSSVLANYSDSDDSDMDTTEDAASLQNSSNNGLPPGFFDSNVSNVQSSISPMPAPETPLVENVSASKSTDAPLPEGFFDDPVLDAKARNIEYKDPVEEEWEKFQKAIAEETNVSNTIIEEDLEETILERNIEQIDEQIHQWERVKNLQVLADDVKMKTVAKDDDNESGNTDNDLDEDDLLDWRSKGVKKS